MRACSKGPARSRCQVYRISAATAGCESRLAAIYEPWPAAARTDMERPRIFGASAPAATNTGFHFDIVTIRTCKVAPSRRVLRLHRAGRCGASTAVTAAHGRTGAGSSCGRSTAVRGAATGAASARQRVARSRPQGERRPVRATAGDAARCRTGAGTGWATASGAKVPAFHWANSPSSAASIVAIRRWNSRPSSSPTQPPDISPARAPFSPVKGLEAGDVFMV